MSLLSGGRDWHKRYIIGAVLEVRRCTETGVTDFAERGWGMLERESALEVGLVV